MAKVEWREIDGKKWFKFNSHFDRFKYFYGHWVSIILFIVMIISIVWAGIYIYQNKIAFFESPFAYGVQKLEKSWQGEMSCSCFMMSETRGQTSFIIDRDGMHEP